MNDTSGETPMGPTSRGNRLESWKEIASYLGRGVTTVQRWEQQEGLPVRRLPHAKKGSVFAFKAELDAWLKDREELGQPQPDPEVEPPRVEQPVAPLPRRRSRRAPLAILMVAGAAAVALALTRNFRSTSTSVRSPDRLFAQPLANDAADETCPTLSPDGTTVVYHWRNSSETGLYIKSLDGGPPRRLSTGGAGPVFECGYPKWSPRGDLIAFVTLGAGEGESKDIWVGAPDGRQPRRLTSAAGIGLCWAPDGETLAFVDRNSPGEPFSVFSIPLAGGPRRRLTTPPLGAFGDTFCAYSPDGRRIAVARYDARYQADVFIASVDDARAPERLTTGLGGIEGLEWSVDGSTILLGTHLGLWSLAVSPRGAKPVRIVGVDGGAKYPSSSRVASRGSVQRIVYQSDLIDVNVWRWDAARSKAVMVAGSTWYDDFPAVTPGGDRLAFASDRTGANEIWVADPDGSNFQQLTFHRGPVVASPQWSPNGARLAFSSQVGDNRDIYVINADGTESTRITTAPSEEANPSWSRDGRWLYFRSDQSGVGQIWKVPVAGGTAVRVTNGEAFEGFESPDGRLFYFVRSADGRGLWSVPVDGGKETMILPDVRSGFWGVADRGIYFLTPPPDGTQGPTTLNVFDFERNAVLQVPTPPVRFAHSGFSVSRDGRFVFWTQVDAAIKDLMLIDPWKR
jgi:Tol biopolymer transport system component